MINSEQRWNILADFMILALKYMFYVDSGSYTTEATQLISRVERSKENAQ